MSNIDQTNHTVVDYVAGINKAFAGQRLSVAYYKTDKLTGVKKGSKCVSIPTLNADEIKANLQTLLPWITKELEKVQDSMIKAQIEEGKIHISDVSINTLEVINNTISTNSNGESNRLTKELIVKWFNTYLEDNLMLAVATKMQVGENPSNEEAKKVQVLVENFKESLSKLAGGKTVFPVKICDKLLQASSLCSEDGKNEIVFTKLVERLNGIKKVAENPINLDDAI